MTENITIIDQPKYNGTHMKLELTDDFIILSNSDGVSPSVSFFDHKWELIKEFPRKFMQDTSYELEVFEFPEIEMMQVFVAGPETISIIEHARDRDGGNHFNEELDVFAAKEK